MRLKSIGTALSEQDDFCGVSVNGRQGIEKDLDADKKINHLKLLRGRLFYKMSKIEIQIVFR